MMIHWVAIGKNFQAMCAQYEFEFENEYNIVDDGCWIFGLLDLFIYLFIYYVQNRFLTLIKTMFFVIIYYLLTSPRWSGRP